MFEVRSEFFQPVSGRQDMVVAEKFEQRRVFLDLADEIVFEQGAFYVVAPRRAVQEARGLEYFDTIQTSVVCVELLELLRAVHSRATQTGDHDLPHCVFCTVELIVHLIQSGALEELIREVGQREE